MKKTWSKIRPRLGWFAVATAFVFPIFTLSGAVDMYLKLSGVDGESTDKGYEKQIDVLAWSWGASNSGTTHTGGGTGDGKASVQDIAVTKYIDKATPSLILNTMNGKHIDTGQLTIRSYNTKGVGYESLKIELKDILVTSVSTGGSGGETRLTENISLNFGSYKLTYIPLVSDSPGSPVFVEWNIVDGTNSF